MGENKFNPSELKISTMTVVSNIYKNNKKDDEQINLDLISRIMDLYEPDDPKTETDMGCLLNIDYYTNLPRNLINFNKIFKSNKTNPFNNQATIQYIYMGFRTINVKIFNNGKLQMTGIQSEDESKYISKCVINLLKTSKIKIYTNTKNLPLENNKINDYKIVYNYKTNNIYYYRWNYLEIINLINNNSDNTLFTDEEKSSLLENNNNTWISDNIINKFINILIKKYENLNSEFTKIHLEIENTENIESDNILYTQKKELYIKKSNLENVIKRLTNYRKYDLELINKLYEKMKDELTQLSDLDVVDDYYEYDIIENLENLKLENIKIELINSDYCTNFMINNTKLHQIVKTKYKLFSSYEPNDYPGVKNKFCWNEKNKNKEQNGICLCEPRCVERGKKSICTQITISVFQSGSVIITGAKSIEQIRDAYKFINKIFNESYDDILRKSTEQDKLKQQEKINNNRKIMRKKRLFYFKKNEIENYPNN